MDEVTRQVLRVVLHNHESLPLLSDVSSVQQLLRVSKSMQSIVKQAGFGKTVPRVNGPNRNPVESRVGQIARWLAKYPMLVGTIDCWHYDAVEHELDFLATDQYEETTFHDTEMPHPARTTYAETMVLGMMQAVAESLASGPAGSNAVLALRTFKFNALVTCDLLLTLQYGQQLTELGALVLPDIATASAVGQLSNLRRLELLGLSNHKGIMKPAFIARAFSNLSALTHLNISSVDDSFDSSHLPLQLQCLIVYWSYDDVLRHSNGPMATSPELYLGHLTALTSLEVWNWDEPAVTELPTQLRGLTAFLHGNAAQVLTSINVSRMRHLQHLEVVWSAYNRQRHEPLHQLAGLPELQSIKVGGLSDVCLIETRGVWETLPKLDSLTLTDAYMLAGDLWRLLGGIGAATGLTHLSIIMEASNAGIMVEGPGVAHQVETTLFAQLARLTRLKHFEMEYDWLTQPVTQYHESFHWSKGTGWDQLSALTALTHLYLRNYPENLDLLNESVDWDALLSGCKNLRYLHVTRDIVQRSRYYVVRYSKPLDWPLASCFSQLADLEALHLGPISAAVAEDLEQGLTALTKLTHICWDSGYTM